MRHNKIIVVIIILAIVTMAMQLYNNGVTMNQIYHWVGLVIVWVSLSVTFLFVGWFILDLLYRKVYLGSWLNHLIDYIRVYVKYGQYPNDTVSGKNVWHYERRIKVGTIKNHFKKDMLELIQVILSLNPEAKKDYDREEKEQSEYVARELKEYGWDVRDGVNWLHYRYCDDDNGFTRRIKHSLWDAWELQKKWNREKESK